MRQVVWTLLAVADLESIRSYLAAFNPAAARDLTGRLIEAGTSLRDFPARGRPVPGTQARELTPIYPYVIRYRVEQNRVVILRVRHGRRRP